MKIFNNKGVSMIAALFVLLSMVSMGAVITYLVAAGEESRAGHFLATRAFYVTQAGIEYGVRKVYEAASPVVVTPISFGGGSFTISQSGKTITVTGTVGDAVRSHSVDSPTEADCTLIDTSNYNLASHGDEVSSITFRKICLTQITVTTMQFSWETDSGERIERIRIESTTIYNNPSGASSGTLLDVADYTTTTGNNNVINDMEWDSDMTGKTVTMTWTFADTSTKTVSFGPLEQ